MKNKLITPFILVVLLSFKSFALSINDLNEPKPLMGRISNTEKIERKIIDNQNNIYTKAQNQTSQGGLSAFEADELSFKDNPNYAELSLRNLADDISYELELDSAKTNADLSVLWNAATARSETMKYTIYKLSNPDEDKPNESTLRKILKPIASFSSVAGASVAADPFMATGALIGGGLANAIMQDDKEVNYKFSKVSDTDMVLLVRKIDDLQKKLIDLYVDYRTKEQLYKMTNENYKKREEIYKASLNKSREELVIADVYYRNAKINAQRAKDEFYTSRAILENLVGKDALSKIEEE